MNSTRSSLIAATCGIILAFPFAGKADTSFTIMTTSADAFLSGANPTLNFGSAGTLAIAPASSPKGEFDSVIMFNTASAVSQFNTTYGAGNWTITGFQLSLASNFGTQGAQPNNAIFNTINAGSFGIDWLADDSWVEGTGGGNGAANGAVCFNSIPALLAPGYDSLGTYTYTPPGNNVYVNYSLALDANLVSDAAAGGSVSLYFYAADNQIGYLFNSREFASNHPQLTITATPVPEPASTLLLFTSLGGLLLSRGQRKKK
ncbi:MAG TPA: PEP-CTERM sorting domain-containing protein [Candidatus Nitrosopolaris sp.]|nr:PEP-CTERM sorting domain-containing protein [Candidatus Nitrosopolaris sp.]